MTSILFHFQKIVFCSLFCFLYLFASENIYTTIEFSDKTIQEGSIKLPSFFKIHTGKKLETIASFAIKEINFCIEKQEMLQAFSFPEPGKADQKKTGASYPVLYLKASILLNNKEKKVGHLYTTVLYFTTKERTQKLLLSYKKRGKAGNNFIDIVYPKKLLFSKTRQEVSSFVPFLISSSFLPSKICLITKENLMRIVPQKEGDGKKFWISKEQDQEGFFLAFYKEQQIFVKWPYPEDKQNMILIQTALAFVQDFFDEKKLLAVWQSKEDRIYSLMLLQRKAKTTYKAKKKYPWRLEIWQWKYDSDEKRVMLAKRGYFFRGILSQKEVPPSISIQKNFRCLENE